MADRYHEHPSPTGWYVDGMLSPLSEAIAADSTVWFALPDEDTEGRHWEGIRALRTAPDVVRLRAVPLFAYNLNYDDEVSVTESAEGALVATGKLCDAGHHTFRVWLGDHPATAPESVIREFGGLGCLIEGYSDHLLGLSCEATQSRTVEAALMAAEEHGRLAYERGRQ